MLGGRAGRLAHRLPPSTEIPGRSVPVRAARIQPGKWRGRFIFRIRAVSWPQSVLAHVGQPIVRLLQARFRLDSAAAMKRATYGRRTESVGSGGVLAGG